ncbi:hypothetical protein R9C00_16610 [Flammeovirgaceae bacterium SG7u.111]|nr:hypothetical protein [Flammeovirgaceae bacterium SG7u.132]WPO33325.1 hypothetical protein R9C00_16610 [Flammeovirgaceae bacterium SG7u.111]
MGLFSKKDNSAESKKSVILDILDDLTFMEINTIIKPAMGASTTPAFDELVAQLKKSYAYRLGTLIHKNNIGYDYDKGKCQSYEFLHTELKQTEAYMQKHKQRMDAEDFVIFSRIMGFCDYLERADIVVEAKDSSAGLKPMDIYHMDLDMFDKYDFKPINPRDKARIRRMYDLGSEKIILQTRFGIDGDVVTRISEHYASAPKEALTKIHDKHVQLSLDYWQSLIKTATELVGGIFGNK